jgi:two-component system nitrogen regulation response regulator NtrX
MAQILVVDDEIGIRELLSEILSDEGHSVRLAENATRARLERARERPDLVLLDIWMPDADGITLLKEWAAGGQLTMPVIMMSGHGTIETAVEATRIGAMDFLEKPIGLQKLLATVKRALRNQETRPVAALSLANFGRSQVLADLKKRLTQIAGFGHAVLLHGERGVMPELYARFLQQPNSPWVNASPALADGSNDVLQQAAGGIVFVDELAGLSKNQQKHLAFLVARAEKSKTRLVSWTAEDPRSLVERGFDAALLAQLSGLTIVVPPLREHAEDIPDFANLMLTQLVETRVCPPRHFSTAALNLLRNFSWPGNLDDLQAAVRNLALTALEEEIGANDVDRVLRPLSLRPAETKLALEMPLREAREAFERAYFEYHLEREGGSIARVAEKSGLERTHLYRKLKSLGIGAGRRDDREAD